MTNGRGDLPKTALVKDAMSELSIDRDSYRCSEQQACDPVLPSLPKALGLKDLNDEFPRDGRLLQV
jgi:hypothetical protein